MSSGSSSGKNNKKKFFPSNLTLKLGIKMDLNHIYKWEPRKVLPHPLPNSLGQRASSRANLIWWKSTSLPWAAELGERSRREVGGKKSRYSYSWEHYQNSVEQHALWVRMLGWCRKPELKPPKFKIMNLKLQTPGNNFHDPSRHYTSLLLMARLLWCIKFISKYYDDLSHSTNIWKYYY